MSAALAKRHITRGIAGGSLADRMKSHEKRNQRRGFRRTQVFSVGRHVAAALDDLSNQLILCEPHGDAVERRASLAAQIPKGMAVAALLGLKHERALSFQSSGPV